MDTLNARPSGDWCGLLSLSLEIRRQIYSYLVPRTYRDHRSNLQVWYRGNTQLLAANKQIHAEVVDMIYGDSTFFLEVVEGSVMFLLDYPSCLDGIFLRDRLSLPDTIATKYITQMRNLRFQIIPSYVAFRAMGSQAPPNTGEAHASAAEESKPLTAPGRGAKRSTNTALNTPHGQRADGSMKIARTDGKLFVVDVVDRQMAILLQILTQMKEILHLHLHVERRDQPRAIKQPLGLWYENPCLLAPLLKLKNLSHVTLSGFGSGGLEEGLVNSSGELDTELINSSGWSMQTPATKASDVQLSRRSGSRL